MTTIWKKKKTKERTVGILSAENQAKWKENIYDNAFVRNKFLAQHLHNSRDDVDEIERPEFAASVHQLRQNMSKDLSDLLFFKPTHQLVLQNDISSVGQEYSSELHMEKNELKRYK